MLCGGHQFCNKKHFSITQNKESDSKTKSVEIQRGQESEMRKKVGYALLFFFSFLSFFSLFSFFSPFSFFDDLSYTTLSIREL